MNERELIRTKFKFIAARAKLATTNPEDWADNIQQAAIEIAREANEILQLSRAFEAGDR